MDQKSGKAVKDLLEQTQTRAVVSVNDIPEDQQNECPECNRPKIYRRMSTIIDAELGEQKIFVNYPCSVCRPEEYTKQLEEDVQANEQSRVDNVLRGSQIAPRFMKKHLDNYNVYEPAQQQALDGCKAYAEQVVADPGYGAWLTLLGNSGTGKNHLAIGILHQAMKANRTVLAIGIVELIEQTKSSFRTGADSEAVLDPAKKVDLLFLDDLGVGYATLHEQVSIYRVLNYRYDYELPTILTSNLPLWRTKKVPRNAPTLSEIYTDRIASRMEDKDNGNILIECRWESYRKRGR